MKKLTFKHYAGGVSLNNISIAVYLNAEGNYVLRAEKNGQKVRGTQQYTLSAAQYNELPSDDYNGLVRFKATAQLCGLDF